MNLNNHAIQNCNNLQQLRQATESRKKDVAATLKPAIDLLNSVLKRLELKGVLFDLFSAASVEEIDAFWEVLLLIDATLTKQVPSREKLTFVVS